MPLTILRVCHAVGEYRARARKSNGLILADKIAALLDARFDIFFSHSLGDLELVVGTKQLINERGLNVYVDWINNAELQFSLDDRKRAGQALTKLEEYPLLYDVVDFASYQHQRAQARFE